MIDSLARPIGASS